MEEKILERYKVFRFTELPIDEVLSELNIFMDKIIMTERNVNIINDLYDIDEYYEIRNIAVKYNLSNTSINRIKNKFIKSFKEYYKKEDVKRIKIKRKRKFEFDNSVLEQDKIESNVKAEPIELINRNPIQRKKAQERELVNDSINTDVTQDGYVFLIQMGLWRNDKIETRKNISRYLQDNKCDSFITLFKNKSIPNFIEKVAIELDEWFNL